MILIRYSVLLLLKFTLFFQVLVLDEADRMLEEAFADQMKELIRLCAKNRQTMLFSATMTDQVDTLSAIFRDFFTGVIIL